jgi:hypothetical protein
MYVYAYQPRSRVAPGRGVAVLYLVTGRAVHYRLSEGAFRSRPMLAALAVHMTPLVTFAQGKPSCWAV